MAAAVAAGAASVYGVEVTIKRVPETMPAEGFKNAGGKADQLAPCSEVVSMTSVAGHTVVRSDFVSEHFSER